MKEQHPLIRLWMYARAHRRTIVWATVCSILNKLFDLAPPLLIGAAVDVVVKQEDSLIAQFGVSDVLTQLWILAILTLVTWGLESLFEYFFSLLWRNLAQTLQHELRLEAYDHVQRLELAYFEDQSTGGLMSILNDDVNQLERFLDVGANQIIQLFTTVVVVGTLFFVITPNVAWMTIVPIPFIMWGSIRFQRWLAPRYAKVRTQVGILNGQLANNLGGIATIKSFTAEKHELNRIAELSNQYREKNRDAIRLSSAFVPIIRMVIVIGFVAIMVFGGQLAVNGALNVGAYSVLVFMTQRLLWPLTSLGNTLDLYQRAMASTTRVLNLLDTQRQIISGKQALPISEVRGHVTFEHVTFEYRSGAHPATSPPAPTPNPSPNTRGGELLSSPSIGGGAGGVGAGRHARGGPLRPLVIQDFSVQIPAGTVAAFVGATGAGKSTLIKLLLRFYDVRHGRILLDGHDIRDLRLPDLRGAMGLVSQDVFLFHGSVRENITYGTFDAPMEEIIAAAQIAEAHDFIMQLPQGYDTIVGERGIKLSGGQRQRISIARAVLKNPPVLILDEATSSVDNETEAAIQRSLERIAVGRTMIVIAHRLSTIRNADCIFVLENGTLREQGRHETLVASNGIYSGLWQVQTGTPNR